MRMAGVIELVIMGVTSVTESMAFSVQLRCLTSKLNIAPHSADWKYSMGRYSMVMVSTNSSLSPSNVTQRPMK